MGFIASGKDTAADYLVNYHQFRRESFATTLKDVVSIMFGWDRTLVEGRTKESREWREQVDTWWANRLGIPHFTPRWVLQHLGTNALRQHFHNDIWIACLENKLRKTRDNIVISDVRFENEIKAIHSAGGIVIRIKRGEDPSWFNDAALANKGDTFAQFRLNQLKVHPSESSWVGLPIDNTIHNDSTIDNLFKQIKNQLLDLLVSTED